VPTVLIESIVRAELRRLGEAGQSALGRRVARLSGEEENTTARRIRYLLRGQTQMICAHAADTILLACGRWLALERIPHFPQTKKAARAMVDAHAAVKGQKIEAKERDRLSHQLLRFSHGFIRGLYEDDSALEEAA